MQHHAQRFVVTSAGGHGDAQQGADVAVCAIRAEHERGPFDVDRAGFLIPKHGPVSRAVPSDVLELHPQTHLCRRKPAQVIEQHTLEVVLRNVCRPAGADQCALLDGRVPDLDPGPFPAARSVGLSDISHLTSWPPSWIRFSSPQLRSNSMVCRLRTVARGSADGVLRRSTRRHRTPIRARVIAATRPAGPPPTTMTRPRLETF